jgi:hypothetical protein
MNRLVKKWQLYSIRPRREGTGHTHRLLLQFFPQHLWLADGAPDALKHPGITALGDKIAEENYQSNAFVRRTPQSQGKSIHDSHWYSNLPVDGSLTHQNAQV